MTLKNIMPPRCRILKVITGILFLLLFENNCQAGQWTMMFYLAADNDLYSQALTDINELQRVSGQPGVDILVQLDSPSGAFRCQVLPQGTSIMADLGAINSGSGRTLADFGIWAVKAFPASKYLLVLWDHGDGWSKQSKFIGIDHNSYLNVADGELRDALAEIVSAAGQPFEVVVFDACHMQMSEVLLELNGMSRYAVGSEAAFPVQGMPYDQAWNKIDGDTPAESLAVSLVNSCSIYSDLGKQVTCSAIDISLLSAAAQNFRPIANRLKQLPVSSFIRPTAVPDSVLSFMPWFSYDLPLTLDFIGNRIPDPEKTWVLDASRQFRNSVLIKSVAGDDYQRASGLAAWFPKEKYNFESGIESYGDLEWSGLSGWDKLLYQLIFQNDLTAPVPQNIKMVQSSGGWGGQISWETGYDPSGIKQYQIRRSAELMIDYYDRGGRADSSGWEKVGFSILPKADGDTAYYSIGGQMTGKNMIQFDTSGNIGFTAEGDWGSLILESAADTSQSWDTLGVWNFYREGPARYCSARNFSVQEMIRISWKPFSAGKVYVDDIKACRPDPAKSIETYFSALPFHRLNRLEEAVGYYQARTIDSLNNTSSWSEAVYYGTGISNSGVWPNPFEDDVVLTFSAMAGQAPFVKVYNIVGQYVDEMHLKQMSVTGNAADYWYYWKPQKSLAAGIYLARINTTRDSWTVKMILIR